MKGPSDWKGAPVAVHQTDGDRFYIRQGRRTASITTIIKRVFPHLFANIRAETLEHARDRGQQVHSALALLHGARAGYTVEWETLDAEVRPRVELINGWLKEHHWHPMHVERAFFSDAFGTGGTPDQVGYFEVGGSPEVTVLDFKPIEAETADLQLAGYSLCVQEALGLDYTPRRVSLNASATKIFPVEYQHHARDRAEFLGALGAYRYGLRKGWWK